MLREAHRLHRGSVADSLRSNCRGDSALSHQSDLTGGPNASFASTHAANRQRDLIDYVNGGSEVNVDANRQCHLMDALNVSSALKHEEENQVNGDLKVNVSPNQ
jgi:hypothetical protein